MESKSNQKKSKAITIATNKRTHELNHILELRDEMIENKIDEKLIKKYVDEQYERINQEYNLRIKKHQDNELKKQKKLVNQDMKIKRSKAIDFLLKNKIYLEENGYKPEYIKKYVDKQYKEINLIYTPDPEDPIYRVDLDQVNFID
jgi:hypothetical protein